MLLFVLFKHNITEKTLGYSGIWTRIVRVEGEHADQNYHFREIYLFQDNFEKFI